MQRLNLYLLVCLCWLLTNQVRAQSPPDFAEPNKAELLLTDADGDKNAAVLILVDEAHMVFDFTRAQQGHSYMSIKYRKRIKILKQAGLEMANQRIYFYGKDNLEMLTDLSAYTYNLDDYGMTKATKMPKKQLYKEKFNDKISFVAFSLPDVTVGSVIEFRYTRSVESGGLPTWNFQGEHPVRYSRVVFNQPYMFRINFRQLTKTPPEKNVKEFKEQINLTSYGAYIDIIQTSFVMRNLPPLVKEPYMSCLRDYQQRIEFEIAGVTGGDGSDVDLYPTARSFHKQLKNSAFGKLLNDSSYFMAGLEDSLARYQPNSFERMQFVHRLISSRYEWNEVKDFLGVPFIELAIKKKGSTGDLNLLLINQLRKAGFKANPMLASTRSNGVVDRNNFKPGAFNYLIARVNLNDTIYYFDASNPDLSTGVIPPDLMNTDALILQEDGPEWEILWNPDIREKNRIVWQAQITPDDKLEGKATIQSHDYACESRLKKLRKDKEEFIKQFVSFKNTELGITDLEWTQPEEYRQRQLEQKFKFTQPLQTSGEYRYFNLNLFTGLYDNPFTAETRYSDVDYGYNRNYAIVAQVTAPEGYEWQELPVNITLLMPDSTIKLERLLQKVENKIVVRINIEFMSPVYTQDNYDAFREFYKKMVGLLNDQVVLRKKA
jgi:Holliday junction resolvase